MAAVPQRLLRPGAPVLPAKRLVAIDAGSHAVKILLVEEVFGRLRVLRSEILELHGDTAASEEEALRYAQSVIREFGAHPVALALPHYRALSQVVDLPATAPADVKATIEEETVKLSGLGESQVVYDYVKISPFGRQQNPYWVTLAQETEVQRQIDRCGAANLDLCEVTTGANALIASYQAIDPHADRVVLVDYGATGTLVAILLGGQAVYTTSFPAGGDALTEALASQTGGTLEAAESEKRAMDLSAAPPPGNLSTTLARWYTELDQILADWKRGQPEPAADARPLEIVMSGGASLLPGLIRFLNQRGGYRFRLWPTPPDSEVSPSRFAVALGTALHALGRAPQPASLLPDEVRHYWKRHHSLQALHSVLVLLLLLVTLGLGLATWQKAELLQQKQLLLGQSQTALQKARATAGLDRELAVQYEQIRPVLQRQDDTLAALHTLAVLQAARTNHNVWFVLIADEPTYFSAPLPPSTNPPATTPAKPTPPVLVRDGFIAELCVPERPEAQRRLVSQIVAELKQSPWYRTVDLLPADQRRPLADPQIIVPDGHFALELALRESAHKRGETADRRASAGAGPEPRISAPGGAAARETRASGSETNGF